MLSRVSRLSFLALLSAGLGYAIFQDGGVLTWGWNICLLITGLVAAAYWILTPAGEFVPAAGPLVGRAIFLIPAYVALQLVPLPFFLAKFLSPARARLTEAFAAVMSRPEFVTLSVAPSTTYSYLLRLGGYIIVFLLVGEITRRAWRDWPWISFVPLFVIGVLEAALGISQNSVGTDVVGTYASKNHFAGLLEMIFPGTIACGITLVKGESLRPPSILRTLSGCAFFLAATSMFVAILYSQSKMGFVAALCGPLAMAVLALSTGKNARRKWLGVSGIAVVLVGAFVFFPSDQVINGFGNAAGDNTAEGRLPVGRDTLRLIADYPLFGSGLGTYSSAFVKYQTANGDVAFTDAHNDYLQLLAELGLLGFALLACWAIPILAKAYCTATRDEDLSTRSVALGCVGGMVAIGIHSLVDFNLYLPANAMVLVWIAGVTAGLPPASDSLVVSQSAALRFPQKPVLVAVSCALVAFSAGSLVFEDKFRGDPGAERWFCRFGICDIDSVLAAETLTQGGPGRPASQSTLLEAVDRDPATPGRWVSLGEALYASGQIDQARRCFLNALALGPNVPPILLGAAQFYQRLGDERRALELASRALAQTAVYTVPIFDWFEAAKLPVSHVLSHGLPQDPGIFRAYLRYKRNSGDFADVTETWNAAASRGYLDDQIAQEYVNWLFGRKEYQAAAQAWVAYRGEPIYLKLNWVFNGDFESELSHLLFDWSSGGADGVKVERDADVKHSGRYSLRIRFEGKQNLTDPRVGQTVIVMPGEYRFEAYIKTRDISTDQGIRLRIYDPTGTFHVEMPAEPLLGTNDWTRLSASICVVPRTKLLAVGLVRQPSLKFDNLLKGSVWVDSVSLSKIAQSCSG